jgi:hypothetical protein
MRKIFLITGIIFWTQTTVIMGQSSNPPNEIRRYNIESAVITYSVSGREQGQEVLYFDRFGMREATFSEVRRIRVGLQRIKTLTLPDWIVTLDFDKKIGKKQKNILWIKLLAEKIDPALVLNEYFIRSLDGKKTGTADFLGRRCEIWQVERTGTTYWLWQGVALKTIITLGSEKLEITAEKIEEGGAIPAEMFVIPEGFFFIEGDMNDIMISAIGSPASAA